MSAEQLQNAAMTPPAIYSGQLIGTGPAPLVATSTPIKRGVTVQWATGTAYVGASGVATGAGFQLGPSGSVNGVPNSVFIATDDIRKVSVNANLGGVRFIAG